MATGPDVVAVPARSSFDDVYAVERRSIVGGAPMFDPADPSAGRPGLDVHTSSSSAVSAAYLEAWYRQGSAAGGGVRPLRTFDEDWHELAVAWPDGRSITITPTGVPQSDLPSRATLQRVADSLTVAREADMAEVRARTSANAAALPVLAAAPTGIGTVEVHGQDGFLRLCLRGAGDEAPRCTTGFGGSSSTDGSAVTTGAWTIDGAWYVAVATRGEAVRIVGGHDSSRSPDAGDLPAESATAGDWTIRLVRPAPDIEMVCTTSEDGSTDCSQHRSD